MTEQEKALVWLGVSFACSLLAIILGCMVAL